LTLMREKCRIHGRSSETSCVTRPRSAESGATAPPWIERIPGSLVPERAALLRLTDRLDVLLLLEEDAQERELLDEAFAAHVRAAQDGDPVDQLARRGALANAREIAQLIERHDRLIDELAIDVGMVDPHDALHELLIREVDEVEDAAPEERVRELLLV